ncbi:forkhead box protein R1 [Sarcoramphus papa]
MNLSFQNRSFWESLHLKNGLEDWDMAEGLKLTITTEEILQDSHLQNSGQNRKIWKILEAPAITHKVSTQLAENEADAKSSSSPQCLWAPRVYQLRTRPRAVARRSGKPTPPGTRALAAGGAARRQGQNICVQTGVFLSLLGLQTRFPPNATFWVDQPGKGGRKGVIYTLLALQGKEKRDEKATGDLCLGICIALELPQAASGQRGLETVLSLVCPIPGSPGVDPAGSDSPAASAAGAAETSPPNTSWDYSDPDCSEEDVPSSSSEAGKLTEDEDASRVDIPVPQEMPETPGLKAMLMPWKSAVLRPQSVKLKCPRQPSTKIEGGWPRPPLNYCILITLALCNSASGSLTVQQIYQFARQHFPFFQTAPEGWKNTIRHNLCFSSCFEKAAGFVCGEGNRKSCLWKLTPEGHRKFQGEAQALPEEALDLVRQSMSEPGTFQRAGKKPRKMQSE